MSRLNGREIDFYYPKITKRDFEVCSLCQKTCFELNVDKLEIHEIKYERPLKLSNMKLLCHGCNHISDLNKENIDGFREETPEFRIRMTVRPIFLEWLSKKMQEGNWHITMVEAVAGGSLYTGRSVQAVKNWLFPLYAAKDSPYTLWGDSLYIRGREPRHNAQEPLIVTEFPDAADLT
jgi:hypothetical protein